MILHLHAGPPSSPDPQLQVLNATALLLSWLPPFTWEGYPIVHYTIQIHNRATGKVMNRTTNATSTGSNTMSAITFNFSTPHGQVLQRCEELSFAVYAANNIGQSEPGEVNGGFPIGNIHDSTHYIQLCETSLKISFINCELWLIE